MKMTAMQIVLLSGLAADENVFTPQRESIPDLMVQKWVRPEPAETLTAYCRRLAAQLPTGRKWIVGGASFGGIAALHLAQFVDVEGVLLIGSVRDPAQLPPYIRWSRVFLPFIDWVPARVIQWLMWPITTRVARTFMPVLSELARQFRRSDPWLMKWSIRQILAWKQSPPVLCPVRQIHGSHDFVLPIRYTSPDIIVPQGGHVISLTHPEDVNDFIQQSRLLWCRTDSVS